MEGKGAVVVTCTTCAMFVFLPRDPGDYQCCKCKLVALLEEKVAALEGEVSTLRQIKSSEEFLNATHTELQQRDDTSGDPSNDVSSWRHVTVRRKKGRHSREPLELYNRFQSLSDSTMLAEVPLASTPTPDPGTARTGMPTDPPHRQQPQPVSVGEARHRRRTRRRVVVIGDSLLRGMEAVCRPDPFSREVCCLPGARIRDITERLPRMITPADHHPFLLIHVGTNDTARETFQKIVGDYEALGRRIKGLGDTQVVFSSILPVIGKGPQRDGKIFQVNSWLRKWCHREGFGFWDHRMNFLEEGLLAKDGLHLTGWGKSVFRREMANLIRRALN